MIATSAYLAGLFDGEGCISIHRCRMWNRPHTSWRWRYKLTLAIAMCDKPTVLWVQAHFGGKVYPRGANSMKLLSAKARQQWVWIIADANAERIIRTIQPYLLNKAPEAQTALEFRASVPKLGQKSSATILEQQLALKQKLHAQKRQEYRV